MDTETLSLPSPLALTVDLTDEQFFQLCQNNRDYQFERTVNGELIIMSPTGGDTGNRNIELAYQLQAWSRQNKLGKAFDSSTGFKLPNGAERSPDASWITIERWNTLTPEQREKFIPLCPDFVVELRSPSDSLKKLQEKMQEYLENGAKLGWLIDKKQQQVEIYRPEQPVEILTSPKTLSGEDVLPEFILDLKYILY
ncbi:Uma2 family endonuclease [Capilliphycus salinus ALCB114379]|uniref:Uma2 family endonuclease n=1 Tax=Capilliphycus salinus TaxID=2768948 RepID=UPI0039A6FC10